MTIQEIIESIDYCLECDNDSIPTTQKDLQTIKEALEKQMPKKPITETINRGISASGEYDIDVNYLCSNCLAVVGDYEANEVFYKFCPECGQALGWAEASDEKKAKALQNQRRQIHID